MKQQERVCLRASVSKTPLLGSLVNRGNLHPSAPREDGEYGGSGSNVDNASRQAYISELTTK